MERHEKILSHIPQSGKGLEIGPSYAPITPRSKGWDCDVLDHLDSEGLRQKYGPGVPIEKIEPVDFIWSGETYSELVGDRKYDYIIASHVIEHVPNLIGFLEDCRKILKPSGVLSLAIPDMRFCFDCLRSVSDVGHVVDAHLSNHSQSSPGRVLDYFSKAVLWKGTYLWSDETLTDLDFMNPLDLGAFAFSMALKENRSYDVHNWTFTPASFKYILQTLNEIGFVDLYEICSHPTEHGEFFITLGNSDHGIRYDRKELLLEMRKEISSVSPSIA